MNRKSVFFYVFGIAVSFALLFLFGFFFSQRAEAQTNTPTPTPTSTPSVSSYFAPASSVQANPIPTARLPKNPKPLCGRCIEWDLAKLWDIWQQKQQKGEFNIDPTRTKWSTDLEGRFPADSPVTVRILRTVEDLGAVEERGAWITNSDSTGSLALSGDVPALAPGGTYFGFACTLSDCSAENMLNNSGSPSIILLQFKMTSPIQINDKGVTKEGDPYIGIDFQLREGVSRKSISAALWKDGETPIAVTDNPLYSFAQPFLVRQDDHIEIYPPGAYFPSLVNGLFRTQVYVPAVEPGEYRIDVGVNDAYEQSIRIPVLPGCAGC